ncbi:MAG: methionine synthase, partial [Sciscionella sp.]
SATGQPVIVHCCAPRPPVGLLRAAGADALGLDGTLLRGSPARVTDALGEILDARATLFLGVVPSLEPTEGLSLHDAALPALELVDRLSFDRALLATQVVPTPTCGLAGASAGWARRALGLVRDLGRAFAEPPESW